MWGDLMITKELLERINFLARKKRNEGLTPEEITEQKKLYEIYLSSIRGQVTNLLENIEFVDGGKKNFKKQNFIQQATINLEHFYH